MTLWFQKVAGLNTFLMRKAGDNASVSWDCQSIQYKRHGIGYPNGDANDSELIKDELEQLLGYRPVEIDEPTVKADQPE